MKKHQVIVMDAGGMTVAGFWMAIDTGDASSVVAAGPEADALEPTSLNAGNAWRSPLIAAVMVAQLRGHLRARQAECCEMLEGKTTISIYAEEAKE